MNRPHNDGPWFYLALMFLLLVGVALSLLIVFN
jgi:hypothetical protein